MSWWQKLLWFNRGFYDYLDRAKKISARLDRDFDALNCHEDFAYRVGYFFKKIKPGTKVVWSLNNVCYFFDPRGSQLRRIRSFLLNLYKNRREKRYFAAVDWVAPLSRYEERWCLDRKLPVRIVRSGLDFVQFFQPVKKPLAGQRFNLLSIGALGTHRRFEDTITAVKILRDGGLDVGAKIVCKKIRGSENAEYEMKLRRMIGEMGLEKEVELLTGGLKEDEMPRVYRETHVFVHPVYLPPPQYYGWGLVVFEAMAAGLPVVLCRVTGATEVLTNDRDALFAEPLDGRDFAEKIKKLIDNLAYYYRVAQNGQDFVKNNISWDKYSRSLLELMGK
jgi:glycosyltransferase involved in cell wall biosynthesis